MNTKKITYIALLLAIAIILPQAFHFTGIPQSGAIFLPMHIPVLIAGIILGPVSGCSVGIIAPMISSLLTGMPPAIRLPFMIGELAMYGLVSGLFFHSFGLAHKKGGCLLSLVISMVAGRIMYAIMIVLATYLLHMQVGGLVAVSAAITTGLPGIIIQLLFIPILIKALEAKGLLHGFVTES